MNHVAPGRPTLLVMHPDPLLRAGLVAALGQHPDFETLLHGAIPADQEGTRIDVVITDHDGAMDLAHLLPPARGPVAAARILVVTSKACGAGIRRALAAGIHGYLTLGGSLDELLRGVTAVANGLRYMSPAVAQCMADSFAHPCLTSREMEVLCLVVDGESNKAIGRHLDIQAGTVKSHITAILSKLGAASRTQAASIATSRGLVEHHLAEGAPGP